MLDSIITMSGSSDKNTVSETKEIKETKWATMDKARISAYRQHAFAEYISHIVEQALEHSSKLNADKDHIFFKPDLKDFYTFNDFKMKGHIVHYGHPKPDGRWTERSEFPEGMPFRTVQKILVATHRLYLTDVSDSNISKNLVFCLSNKYHRSERKLWHGYQFIPLTSKQANKKRMSKTRSQRHSHSSARTEKIIKSDDSDSPSPTHSESTDAVKN